MNEVRKTVKFPRLSPVKIYWLEVYKKGLVETRNGLEAVCKKQDVEGVEIPKGFVVFSHGGVLESVKGLGTSSPKVGIEGKQLEGYLRKLVMDKLRGF